MINPDKIKQIKKFTRTVEIVNNAQIAIDQLLYEQDIKFKRMDMENAYANLSDVQKTALLELGDLISEVKNLI